MEDLSMSIKFTRVIYELSRQSKDIDVMLSTQFYLGNLFYDLGDHQESMAYYEEAYSNAQESSDSN